MYEDKTLKCVECGEEFVFTASEQEFYAEKGFTNEPKRCPKCRSARAARKRKYRSSLPMTVLFTAMTASSNAETEEATKNKG